METRNSFSGLDYRVLVNDTDVSKVCMGVSFKAQKVYKNREAKPIYTMGSATPTARSINNTWTLEGVSGNILANCNYSPLFEHLLNSLTHEQSKSNHDEETIKIELLGKNEYGSILEYTFLGSQPMELKYGVSVDDITSDFALNFYHYVGVMHTVLAKNSQ